MKKKWLYALACAILTVCMLTGCIRRQQTFTYYSGFDTVTHLQLTASAKEAKRLSEGFEAELMRYHQLFDIYYEYQGVHNIKTINDAAGKEAVSVAPEIIELLKLGKEIYERSGGQVNICMGSVLTLWHECRMEGMEHPESAKLPEKAALERAAAHINPADVIIDEAAGTVYIKDPELRLDVGAVAKGFAAGKLAGYLKSQGVTSALLDVGGNDIAIGHKPDGSVWRLALQNPDLTSEASYSHLIGLADGAIVTSGDYQRYYTVDGKKYHHIIDPKTLMPTTYFTAVSVISTDSGLADALSTALFSMDEAQGRALLEAYPGTQALWTYPDGVESMTEHFQDYILD